MAIPLADALARYPGAESFRPGDSPELNAEVIGLIASGKKTMTCEAWSVFENGDEATPKVGRTDIVLNWKGEAVCAVQTVLIETLRFSEMTEDRVPPQAEFRDLDHWRKGYKAQMTRQGIYDPEMSLMVETFRLVEVFA